MFSPPAVADGLVFIGSCSGAFLACGLDSGKVHWSYDIKQDGGLSFHGDFLLSDDRVYVGTDGDAGSIYAFERATGKVSWTYAAGIQAATDLLQNGSKLYAVTRTDTEGRLVCLDMSSGEEIWTLRMDDAVGPPFVTNKSPCLVAAKIYYGGADGLLYAFDAETGEALYTRNVGASIVTTVTVHGEELYFGTSAGLLMRATADSGDIMAEYDLGGEPYGPPTIAGESVVVFVDWTQPQGDLICLDLALERELWRVAPPAKTVWSTARPFHLNGEILVGNDKGGVFAYRRSDGVLQWTLHLKGAIRVFKWSEGTLFVGTIEGDIFALR